MPVLKTGVGKPTGGSNPSLTAWNIHMDAPNENRIVHMGTMFLSMVLSVDFLGGNVNVICRHSSIGKSAELKPQRLSVRPGLSARYHHISNTILWIHVYNSIWCVRIAAIAADCKSAPTGSRVRVPHAPRRIPAGVLVIRNGHKVDYRKRFPEAPPFIMKFIIIRP